jgi:hypothetical protein
MIEEKIWRIRVWRFAALPQCCKRLILMVLRLFHSPSSRMVWPRPNYALQRHGAVGRQRLAEGAVIRPRGA